MSEHTLTERERKVLEAVIHSYVETAEPAGSRTIAKKFNLGVSAATIRNTMSDLEEMGYLYHPHTSAGRIPTDRAYRLYVDRIINRAELSDPEKTVLRERLTDDGTAIEGLLDKAAQVLGIVTQELGLAVSPSFDEAILEQLQLVSVSSHRILMVLVLRSGAARTIFVEVSSDLPAEAVDKVAAVLNERLRGLSLQQIRTTLRERLRDSFGEPAERELINIFVEESDQLFHPHKGRDTVVLSSAQMLAEQPEFASNERMRDLLVLTERREVLQDALRSRRSGGMTITIGGENVDPTLSAFTLVTSTYKADGMSGVIGVMGPTRMPYDKVIALVEHTSRLIEDLL